MKNSMNGFRGIFVIFLTLIVLIVIGMFFTGCAKDDEPAPMGKPVITISQSLNSDGIVTVKWEVYNTDSVFCNNIYIAKTEIQFPVCDSILVFVAQNGQYEARETVRITKPVSPTGTVTFTYNGVTVDSLPYPGGEFVVVINFTNGFLVFNDITYKKSPVSITLSTIGTDVFDFVIKGICEEITISLVVPVKDLTTREQQMISGSLVEGYSRVSYTSPNGPWEETGIDYSDPCMRDNVWTFFFTPDYQRKVIFDQGILCAGGVAPVFTFDWKIEGDSLFIGDGPATRLIKNVDWSTMVYIETSEWNEWNGSVWIVHPCWYEKTFYHLPQR